MKIIKRKGGANSFGLAISIKGLTTIELVEIFVDMVADEYPDKQFDIQYDGIYSIVVKCDNSNLYDGNGSRNRKDVTRRDVCV